MVRNIDHVTVAVRDLAAAKAFFALLGFREEVSVVISGPTMERYMAIPGLEADHVTLVLQGSSPRFEIQILRYRAPEPHVDPFIGRLDKLGYNHICFAVSDLDAELANLRGHGVRVLNEVMAFHDRRLVYLAGPEGITVELAEWGSRSA